MFRVGTRQRKSQSGCAVPTRAAMSAYRAFTSSPIFTQRSVFRRAVPSNQEAKLPFVIRQSQLSSSYTGTMNNPQLGNTIQKLTATLLAQCSSKSQKHIILSNPHPGAIYYNQDLVFHASTKLPKSCLVSLDFKDLLDIAHLQPHEKETAGNSSTLLDKNIILTTTSFSPSIFKSRDESIVIGNFQNPSGNPIEKSFKDEQNDDENDLDEQELDLPEYFIQKKHQFLLNTDGQKIMATKVPLDSISDSKELTPMQAQRLFPNHYSQHITPLQLKHLTKQLYDSILKLTETNKSTVLFIKDMTDMIVNSRHGIQVYLALMFAIRRARNKGRSAALVFNFTPSLLDSENISKPFDFYESVFAKQFEFGDSDGTVFAMDLWKAKQINLFSTPFDAMQHKLVKISCPPVVGSTNAIDTLESEASTMDWLVCMQQDMKERLREINWKNLISAVHNRKWIVPGAKNMLLKSHENNANNLDKRHLHYLESRILTKHELDDIVDLAYGCKLKRKLKENQNSEKIIKGRRNPDSSIIDLQCFAEALLLSEESDHRGSNPDVALEQDSHTKTESGINDRVKTETHKTEIPLGENSKVSEDAPRTVDQSKLDTVGKLSAFTKKLSSYEKKLMSTVVDPNLINVQFSDLVLPATTKLALQTVVTLPLLYPAQYSTGILAKYSINGVLLFGPPGTGKTMLAKALAKAGGAKFMKVALSDIFDKYVGEGEKNVKAIFTLARKLSPCVVFLDEVDAVFGARRGDQGNGARREVINEFMTEWDGLTSNNEGVLILGATNRPFDLDDAILRRMPRRILVDLPTEAQRLQILESHLKGEVIENVNLEKLANITTNYSGSDLKNVCVSAAITCVKRMVTLKQDDKLGTHPNLDMTLRVLQQEHFDVALREIPPSLTDEMQTLIELRKWNESYGENASASKSKAKGWGFKEST